MADKKIEIELTSSADTKGAEEMKDSLDGVKDATKKADAEAGESSRRQSAVEEIATRTKAIAWAQAAEKIQQYGEALKNLKAETSGLSEEQVRLANVTGEAAEKIGGVVSSVAQGFAAGGPIGAILAGAVNGLGLVLRAANDADKAVNAADESSKRTVDYWKQLQNLKITLPIALAAEEANRILDEQLDKLVRNERVAQSARSLEQATQENAGSAAVRAGTQTEQGAEALNLATAAENQIEAINAKLTIANAAQMELKSRAESVAGNAKTLSEGSQEQIKELDKAKELQKEADTGAKDLADLTQIAEKSKAEIRGKFAEQIEQNKATTLETLTQAATQERDALKAEVDRLGVNASAGARASLAIWEEILEDGKIRANELGRYHEAQGRLNGMMEKANAKVLEAFRQSEKIVQSYERDLDGVISRLNRFETARGNLAN